MLRALPSWLALALLLLIPHVISSSPVEEDAARVDLSDDGKSLRVIDSGGDSLFEYSIEEWRRWAEENLSSAIGGPVRIGEQEMSPAAFDRLGAAVLSPRGERVALTTSTYAILTTVSVVGILDLDDGTFEIVSEPAFGSVEEMVWSSGGEFIAYSLGTARAQGDRLRIDNVASLVPAVSLEGEDLLEAATDEGQIVASDPRQWQPAFRNLSWSESGRLHFESNDVGSEDGGAMRWSISSEHGGLKIE